MRIAVVAILLAGCTAHNPNYVGDGGAPGGGADLAGVAPGSDLAMLQTFDLAGPLGPCQTGQRMCSGTVASDRCEAGMFVVDRQCPANSDCTATYCAPPASMVGTQIGLRCDASPGAQQIQCLAKPGVTCQPFVNPSTHSLRWFCDSAVGAGTGATPCTKGSDCRSGVCTLQGNCFDACQQNNDCPLAGDSGLSCVSLTITVEGVTVTQKGCR